MGICKRYTLVLLLKNMALTTKDGDGYYESCIVVIEGNQIEITV